MSEFKALLKKAHAELGRHGFLMLSDAELPSFVAVITGEPVKGSWWGHPKGNLIFNLSQQFEDNPDLLLVKLVNKKVTFVHKRHWPALFSLAMSDSEWQKKKMATPVLGLLKQIEKKQTLRVDDPSLKKSPTEIGKLATKLEERLLIYSESMHTDSGKHVRYLRTWKQLVKERKFKFKVLSAEFAQEELTKSLQKWAGPIALKLPWK